jgi:hypothetical protein
VPRMGAAAVDEEPLASDEGGFVGDEEAHGAGNVVACAPCGRRGP